METPVSLFLLIIAVGLILSTLSLDRSSSEDDSEIFRIRTVQAGSIGSILLDHNSTGGMSLIIDEFLVNPDRDLLQILISPGSFNYSSDPGGIGHIVETLIFTTPDRLPVSILLYRSDSSIPVIPVDHAAWSIEISGVVLEVSIPIHRVPVELLGVV